jgi:CheY-like chemotaxis protein
MAPLSRVSDSDTWEVAVSDQAPKARTRLRHDLGNELAVVGGFAWLALTSLRQLSEKVDGDAKSELQSIISMVDRIKASGEQARQLLAPNSAAPAPTDAELAPSSSKQRILAVDDSLPLLALLSKVLTQSGYEVESFADPQIALRHFGESPESYSAIVTDEQMPEMTGAMLAEEIRAIRRDIPIVLCTGMHPSERRIKTDWAQAIVRKPYRPRDLSLMVHGVIAESEKAQSHTSVACATRPVSCDDRANA